MIQDNSPALSSDPLYAKSQVYIARGNAAKAQGEIEQYQLWASLALELLGKAILSAVHPALVADPTHCDSLWAACGKVFSTDVKTITAKTLFVRLSRMSKAFDKRIQSFCTNLSMRRNSELHSGESPFSGMSLPKWEYLFWHTAQIVLAMQDRSLQDWLGADEANATEQTLNEAHEAHLMAVKARIEHHRANFLEKHSDEVERQDLVEASDKIDPSSLHRKFSDDMERFEAAECPSCKCKGVIAGCYYDENIVDQDYSDPSCPPIEWVESTIVVEEFHCVSCDLKLSGTTETSAANLTSEFTVIEEREIEFEPDYGND